MSSCSSQRAQAIKRRKAIWEALHPAKPQRFESVFDALGTAPNLEVEQAVPPQVASHGGARPQTKSFAAATAEASGMTKQAINRSADFARLLADGAKNVTRLRS